MKCGSIPFRSLTVLLNLILGGPFLYTQTNHRAFWPLSTICSGSRILAYYILWLGSFEINFPIEKWGKTPPLEPPPGVLNELHSESPENPEIPDFLEIFWGFFSESFSLFLGF